MMRLLPVLGLWLALIAPAAAQVAFDARNSATSPCAAQTGQTFGVCNGSGAASLTFTHVMGGVSNGALVVMVMWGNSTVPTGLTATYNGVSMTQVTGTNTGTNGGCTCAGVIFALLAPTSGSHSVVISWTGSLEVHATSASFSGVNQSSVATAFPHGTFVVQNAAAASPATTAVTSATNNMVAAFATEQSSSWGTISGNLIALNDMTGPQLTYASDYTSGAATVNPSFAFGANSTWSIVATDILAAGGGSPAPPTRTLLGVGQ